MLYLKDPNFTLELPSRWEQIPNEDPEQYNFRDAGRDVAATLSAMDFEIDPADIDLVAENLANIRVESEADAARRFNRPATINEPVVIPQPSGRYVAYYGSDHTSRQFNFAGFVTPRTIISLYISSDTLSQDELLEVMHEINGRLDFDCTPISHDRRPH